ncbi:MAG: GNAT family N-acetyltransferase [Bacillati bacterium ANGP1]|uniref:GNAT family N-acetyltransferase n=1 Tax=Candidatus Segetimicrobium genomatis TaxID=2569760 RepID=A0A537LMA5_9BACT|nr:MAG: GNAT family N-acetyltransferase [Terrabacteria group bacterium ANGP1]
MAATRGGGDMTEMTGLKGEKVRLVPPDKHAHLENSLRWLNDPEVTHYLLMTIGVTRGMEEEWFDRVQKRDTEFVWAILDDQDRHIGFTGIHRINWKLRLGGTGTVIGEKSAWRKGFGSDAMQVRTKFAFETLGLHRLESEARADNIGSQRALEKAGYRREGMARKKMFWGGQWYDTVLYGMLDEDYFTGRRS